MGLITSKVGKFTRNWNIENRAQRFLEHEKRPVSPTYEANIKDMQRTLEVDPKFFEKANLKDAALDERLKNVYVKSTEIEYALQRKNDPNKPLPKITAQPEDFEFGYLEPEKVSPGRCTLRQALKFITDNHTEPEIWHARKIAEDYKMKEELVNDILFYFKLYNVYLPDKTSKTPVLEQTRQYLLKDKETKNAP